MSITKIKKTKGFSLLEVMLAVLILAMIAVFALRMQGPKFRQAMVDHAATQMKQIMEAATSYYIDNGQWPTTQTLSPGIQYDDLNPQNITELTAPTHATGDKNNAPYLPSSILNADSVFMSPFGSPYSLGPTPHQTYEGPGNSALFFEVQVDTKDPQAATLLRSKLPLSFIAEDPDGKLALVTAYVNIPSYDYNHAQAVSDVGVYHPGDCIPRPSYACPEGMQATIFVTLEQGYGYGTPIDSPTPNPNADTVVYPITGASAYTMPGTAADGTPMQPNLCPEIFGGTQEITDGITHDANPTDSTYCPSGQDRVCVAINTTNGPVAFDNKRLANTYVIAMTKCTPKNS